MIRRPIDTQAKPTSAKRYSTNIRRLTCYHYGVSTYIICVSCKRATNTYRSVPYHYQDEREMTSRLCLSCNDITAHDDEGSTMRTRSKGFPIPDAHDNLSLPHLMTTTTTVYDTQHHENTYVRVVRVLTGLTCCLVCLELLALSAWR